MRLLLEKINLLLQMMGISNLSVKFESDTGQIRAKFNIRGKPQEKIITFEEIEQLFYNPAEDAQDSPHATHAARGGG